MSRKMLLSILAAVLCAGCVSATDGGVVGCYYETWSDSRPGKGQFDIEDLPVGLCTHIMYSFYSMATDGTIIAPEEATTKSCSVDTFINLKTSYPEVSLLASIGGWSGSENFSTVVNNETSRKNFVANVVELVESKGFAGVDLAWDYPGLRNGVDTDKAQFIVLLSELKEALGDQYLLTAAVAVTQYYIDAGYDVSGLAKYLDYIFIQTYEYHGSYDGVTGVNAPTFGQTADDTLSVNNSIAVWIKNGAPASKLVLGMGAFGKTYTLTNSSNTDIGASITGPGDAGPYTQEAGVLAYYEICELLKNETSSWTVVEDECNYVYAYNGLQWIGYDNENTILAKGQLAKTWGLAGIFVWAIDEDDFRCTCGTSYPILRSAIAGYTSTK